MTTDATTLPPAIAAAVVAIGAVLTLLAILCHTLPPTPQQDADPGTTPVEPQR